MEIFDMKWVVSLFDFGEADFLFKTEDCARSVLAKQLEVIHSMKVAAQDITVFSNRPRLDGPFDHVGWQVMSLDTVSTDSQHHVYLLADLCKSGARPFAVWDAHFPLLDRTDFEKALEAWTHYPLIGAFECLRKHLFYLFNELDIGTGEIDAWLPRTAVEGEVNGRQDLKSLYHLSGAFMMADGGDKRDWYASALSGEMDYIVLPESKAFSLQRGRVESCCVDEILKQPDFYTVMGNNFTIAKLDKLYPENTALSTSLAQKEE